MSQPNGIRKNHKDLVKLLVKHCGDIEMIYLQWLIHMLYNSIIIYNSIV